MLEYIEIRKLRKYQVNCSEDGGEIGDIARHDGEQCTFLAQPYCPLDSLKLRQIADKLDELNRNV